MIPKDIKEMSTDELEMEYSFLWNILDNLHIKRWEELNERMRYVAYELCLRETPIMCYHYLVEDERHKSDWYRINWKERRFIKLNESSANYDRPQSYNIRIEEFINRCKHDSYDDKSFSFRYLIKVNDYFITVNPKNSAPSVDAAKKDCLRKDFKFIKVEVR